jgi:UDP-N-acetylmuramoylalanine-D-glutamate ligase
MAEQKNTIDFALQLIEARKKAMEAFSRNAHLHLVASIKGIMYVLDEEGHKLENSLRTLQELDGPLVWIFSNNDMAHFYNDISPVIADKVKAVISINRNCDNMLHFFKNDVEYFADAKSIAIAVNTTLSLCATGDVVLFSPGSEDGTNHESYEASIQEFKNYVLSLSRNQ